MTVGPLWIDVEARAYPSLEGDLSVDVAIVGAGLAGVGAAYALRESGLRVVVLERGTVSSGASGRNAGFVVGGPALPFVEGVRRLGRSRTEEIWELTLENNRALADLIEERSIDCGYLRRGSMSLAASEEEVAELLDNARALSASGIHACLVQQDELPQPFNRMYLAGLYHPGTAEMNPGRFTRAVAASLGPGVAFYEDTSVLEVRRDGGWRLDCPGGQVRAETVILASNAWTGQLLPSIPISPRRGQVVATSVLPSVRVPFPMGADHGYRYWRQTAEGRLVVGGWRNLDFETEATNREGLNPRIGEALEDFSRAVAGPEIQIDHRWAGIMGFTPDMLPLAGQVPRQEGLWLAAGYSGHGVCMAFTCGGRVATQAAAGEAWLPACFDPGRFAEVNEQRTSDLFQLAGESR